MLSLEKVKNGLETFGYEYANNILCGHTKSKIEMKINKVVANNSWVKDNLNYLKSKNYFYHH